MAKKLKWNLILMSLLYLALGIFLLMVPGTALNVVCCALRRAGRFLFYPSHKCLVRREFFQITERV